MADEIINEENLKKDKMLSTFMILGYNVNTSVKYYSYILKRTNNKIQLIKGSAEIAMWDIENDRVRIFDKLSTAEKRIAEKFTKLPGLAEQLYKIEKENKRAKKPDKYSEGRAEIKQILLTIPDTEMTKEILAKLIKKLSYRYVDQWQGGGNADCYNDNYINYLMQTECDIKSIMINIGIDRVTYLLAEPNNKVYWDRYNDNELLKMVKIIPLSAQQEGNLVTITEEEHNRFEQLCEDAYKYAKKYLMKQPLRELVPEAVIEVCWWEKDMKGNRFFIPEQELERTPNTYREAVLKRLRPKPRKSAKPSRLSVNIFFDENDKEGNVKYLLKKWESQLGIIKWKYHI